MCERHNDAQHIEVLLEIFLVVRVDVNQIRQKSNDDSEYLIRVQDVCVVIVYPILIWLHTEHFLKIFKHLMVVGVRSFVIFLIAIILPRYAIQKVCYVKELAESANVHLK